MSNRRLRSARQPGGLVLLLFGLPFAGAGLALLWFLVLPMLRDWHDAQTWLPVSAEVLSAELKTTYSSKGGATYRAVATYRYRVQGVEYTGDRVSFSKGSDNIGDFQQMTAAVLANALQSGRSVTVYVDPAQPSRAVYSRALRPGLLALSGGIGVLFAMIGIGIMVSAIRARLRGEPFPAVSQQPSASASMPEVEPDSDETVAEATVDQALGLRQTGRGVQWYLPAGRASGWGLLVAAAFVVAMAWLFARQGGWTAVVPVLVLGVIGCALLASWLWQKGNALAVDVIDNWVTIRRSLFGVVFWQQKFPVGKVKSLACSQGMVVKSGTQTTFYYRVVIMTLPGETFIVADNLRGKAMAMATGRRLAAVTGWSFDSTLQLDSQAQLLHKKGRETP